MRKVNFDFNKYGNDNKLKKHTGDSLSRYKDMIVCDKDYNLLGIVPIGNWEITEGGYARLYLFEKNVYEYYKRCDAAFSTDPTLDGVVANDDKKYFYYEVSKNQYERIKKQFEALPCNIKDIHLNRKRS